MLFKDYLFSIIGEYVPIKYSQLIPSVLPDGTVEMVEYFTYSVDWPWIIASIAFILSLYVLFQFFVKGIFSLLGK